MANVVLRDLILVQHNIFQFLFSIFLCAVKKKMWLCRHIHFMHQLIGVLFLQSLLLPLSGELPHQNFGKLKPHIWTRTTLEMEARQLCQTTMVLKIVGYAPLLSLPPPSTHLHTHVHMHTFPVWYCVDIQTEL